MSKFQKKRGKSSPAISTASLPDIIFMLLITVTTIKKNKSIKMISGKDAVDISGDDFPLFF